MMKKIPSLFVRNFEGDMRVRDEVTPGVEWVIAGEGVATRKFDGSCCRVTDEGGESILWKRYDAKHGKPHPPGFVPAQELDPNTGHQPGWIKCSRGNPADKYFFEAYDRYDSGNIPFAGTYELCGPKINGNPEGFENNILIPHGIEELPDAPRDYAGLKAYLAERAIEGIVWHHPDGRMVKIKKKDFPTGGAA